MLTKNNDLSRLEILSPKTFKPYLPCVVRGCEESGGTS